mgnify:CR=1 FL=1
MSAGGSSMLADLIAELEELGMPPRSPKSQLEHPPKFLPLDRQSGHHSTAIVGTIMRSHSSKEISPCPHGVRLLHPAANLLDIFV